MSRPLRRLLQRTAALLTVGHVLLAGVAGPLADAVLFHHAAAAPRGVADAPAVQAAPPHSAATCQVLLGAAAAQQLPSAPALLPVVRPDLVAPDCFPLPAPLSPAGALQPPVRAPPQR